MIVIYTRGTLKWLMANSSLISSLDLNVLSIGLSTRSDMNAF